MDPLELEGPGFRERPPNEDGHAHVLPASYADERLHNAMTLSVKTGFGHLRGFRTHSKPVGRPLHQRRGARAGPPWASAWLDSTIPTPSLGIGMGFAIARSIIGWAGCSLSSSSTNPSAEAGI